MIYLYLLMTAWPLLLIIHQFSTASYKDALPEILEVLRAACLTHKLPLAQTWVTYSHVLSKENGAADIPMRTTDTASPPLTKHAL